MNLDQLIRKIIPVTPNEQKCALDREMREEMRRDTKRLIQKWHEEQLAYDQTTKKTV